MTFSVVVPTYKRPQLIARCLHALLEQAYDKHDYEIIVVDDGNDADTQRTVTDTATTSPVPISYLAMPQRSGPAAARNRGWQAARGDIIALTDDDTIPDANWLRTAKHYFDDQAEVISGGVRVPLSENPTDYERNIQHLETAEFITANCFIRRTILQEIGGLDERFDIAWREDSDLQFTLLEHGYSIAKAPEAVVVHPVRPAPWYISLKEERKKRYDALLYKKHVRLFRERMPRHHLNRPLYYGAALAFVLMIGFALFRNWRAAGVALICWAVLAVALIIRRMNRHNLSPRRFGAIIITSLLLPFLSVYWRVYGAIKYRSLYV